MHPKAHTGTGSESRLPRDTAAALPSSLVLCSDMNGDTPWHPGSEGMLLAARHVKPQMHLAEWREVQAGGGGALC